MLWIILSLFIIAILFCAIKIRNKRILETVTKLNRGTKTERKLVLKLLKYGVPSQTIFHDLYLNKKDGSFSQIDLVVATKVGIIVFEVKNYKGWIFGTGYKPQWVQVLAYGKSKFRFYNPILQNSKHIQDLKKQLPMENVPFFSVIVFFGDCVLKNIDFVPDGTFLAKSGRIIEVIKTITKNNNPANYHNKGEIIRVLNAAVVNGESDNTIKHHIENVKGILGKHRIFD